MSDIPRPPRRVPPGADGTALRGRTAIETGAGGGARPSRPVRPPRAWYLLPLLIAVIAAGAGVGWLVREQGDGNPPLSGGFDPDDVLKSAGPAVVKVHASACTGDGLATGVMIDRNRVLTVASALEGPIAVAVETADGRVREATVTGVDDAGTGVAELKVLGAPLDVPVPSLAEALPADDGNDVPVVGFSDGGEQQVDLHAITRTADGSGLTGVSGLLPAASAGAPVFDRNGRTIGLLTTAGSDGATAVGLHVLREFRAQSRRLKVEDRPDCHDSKGVPTPVVPALDGPSGPLATETQTLLGEYVTRINRHDPQGVRDLFTGALLLDRTLEAMREQYRMLLVFEPVIHSVVKDGDGARVEMTHTGLDYPRKTAQNLRCLRYNIGYELERVDGELRIANVYRAGGSAAFTDCTKD
jgi:Trypsin-like peptidase domain